MCAAIPLQDNRYAAMSASAAKPAEVRVAEAGVDLGTTGNADPQTRPATTAIMDALASPACGRTTPAISQITDGV
jgi:hypothetical protein